MGRLADLTEAMRGRDPVRSRQAALEFPTAVREELDLIHERLLDHRRRLRRIARNFRAWGVPLNPDTEYLPLDWTGEPKPKPK